MDDPLAELIVLDSDSPEPVDPAQDDIFHNEASCKDDVRLIFPNICPDYLTQLALEHNYESDAVITAILDKQEQGVGYPTQHAIGPHSRKRKRGDGSDPDEDSEGEGGDRYPESVRSIKLKIATHEYVANTASSKYLALARVLISQDFPLVPQNTIRNFLLENGGSLFETYTAMDEKLRNSGEGMPWVEKKTLSRKIDEFAPDKISSLDMTRYNAEEQAALTEFKAARDLRAVKDAKIMAEAEERENFIQAQAENQTSDCGICFEECALNCMVPCEGEPMHWFCRSCLKHQAESQIGMSKYELTCMSMDGCSAGFSQTRRALFLDKKLTVALDRIEQEAVLRMAGIENLETCPFCPYAAEYPPAEVDKEFRCENPQCKQVSCRLCRKETHIPKSCAEAEADRGLDARHVLEEAMSEALIRRCNNCKNPFVKQDGCNKIKCTKCNTLQCDVCRQTIKDYTHFNDQRRGGKAGRCPLFDQSEERYEKEVSKAEVETRKKVVEENPGMDEEALRIPAPEGARQVEDSRRAFPARIPYLHRNRFRVPERHWDPRQLGNPPHVYQGNIYPRHGEIGNNNLTFPGRAIDRVPQPNQFRPQDRTAIIADVNDFFDGVALRHLWQPHQYVGPAALGDLNAEPILPRPPNLGNIIGRIGNMRNILLQARQPIGIGVNRRRVFQQLSRIANPPPGENPQPPAGAPPPRSDVPLDLPAGFPPNPFIGLNPYVNRAMHDNPPGEPFPVSSVRDDPVREQDAPHYRR
ncbi:hypothetical protein F4861DRAFT_446107 [Xylaria intraflava]|nr:hypothetical protein F4861DRAFT_446107 [Xylaria intraflava]